MKRCASQSASWCGREAQQLFAPKTKLKALDDRRRFTEAATFGSCRAY